MSYQVLARKWRPRIFREMVGQEHVLRALINALDHNRLHHAYLFTGTRGVGKTTIARILAKCLNCEQGVSSEPCGQCGACLEIAEGRFIDLIEVDAASKTKVEDTRELLDNVQYAPTRGRYKVYLIDEVHMLSNSSFNALLKTLEEPPPHVKFLLATTDPQKLPVTVLSRCLQFNLKNMNPERIVGHLQFVLSQEMVPFDEPALWQLGRAADGSMRDALSLTDQAIAFGSGKISDVDVRTMLGSLDQAHVASLCLALAELDASKAMQVVAQMAEQAPDYDSALAELLGLLHRIAIAQAVPEAVDNSTGDRDQVIELGRLMPSEDVQLFYQTALLGRRDLPLSPDPRGGFEMVILRMLAFKPQGVVKVPTQRLAAKPAAPQTTMESGSAGTSTNLPATEPVPAQSDPEQAEAIQPQTTQNISQATAEPVPPNSQSGPGAVALEADIAEQTKVSEAAQSAPFEIDGSVRTRSGAPVVQSPAAPETQDPPAQLPSAPHENAPVEQLSAAVTPSVEPQMLASEAPVSQVSDGQDGSVSSVASPSPESNSALSATEIPPSAQQAAPEAQSVPEVHNVVEPEVPAQDVQSQAQEAKAKVPQIDFASIEAVAPPPVEKSSATKAAVIVQPHEPLKAAEVFGFDQLAPDKWIDLYRQLKFGGVLQSTASNCELIRCEGTELHFLLDRNNSSLYDPAHQQRMADEIGTYFNNAVTVNIEHGSPQRETPALFVTRLRRQRQEEALAAIQTDPLVVRLIEEFDARIIEDSVKPVGQSRLEIQ